ncbi:substrate-binding component of ABC transporter [Streptomyces davaonensis JCM 4913]|uniref:Substrate-binding component of ABC transporter n=1 Tax=Streptomyces davaonensis (strain DSM 101723 / JCM 4913 / KCC S-0913 / 768) TaxID=1214101 RepID=K4R1H3_STRDJ|nr:substrate-binding domain-containing protein [Streptomyces davaonensis]CCK26935.1 substrate-binding component of ABC transporter [Streptomyces davaonensis JCM 4913]
MRVPPRRLLTGVALAALLPLAACSSDKPEVSASTSETPSFGEQNNTGAQSKFFNQADYDAQLAMRSKTPEGPEGKPWEQMIDPEMVDTAKHKKDGPYKLCFSNAAVNNPWRQVGWKTMQEEAALHKEIAAFTALDAEGKDDKQISDIAELQEKDCDALIVSPNTTATLTPAVTGACPKVPVIVFDRGVDTDCPVTFIKPIGGYAFGADAAEFLIDKVEPKGKILALRILPGVDVLETRWSAAKVAFDKSDLDVVGVEFTDGDAAKTKSIVSDYIQREGKIDGIWMDAGATAVPAVEAFEDAGLPVPPINGEDQQDFLQKWKDSDLTAIAPTYPTYQWRTPVIAALKILKGEQVPKVWNLPQPSITQDNLSTYLKPGMPPLHYALCGCEDMPGYPKKWGGKE